ncbi:hypothetical protein QVD17_19999 [Tagetes erecta]|uniref:Uncharacterized protein n=1 Tax=Tagetes erecta TaxID=13708 RepID=A0AAD8NQL8_TARER|nr:hypothetical protein QVD17_19999 [Tagetes erecta]
MSPRLSSPTVAGNSSVIRAIAGPETPVASWWIKSSPVFSARNVSTMTRSEKEHKEEKVKDYKEEAVGGGGATTADDGGRKGIEVASYWGVPPSKVVKDDGSEWKWNCFRPWETYQADLSIDLKKHHVPKTFLDKFAYWTVWWWWGSG